ncbi:aerotolerance regulator BatC [Lacinutrix iliipiscaria]|uniref:Aerotolerance regulator BatC n=1 Tax=Lacinutrix iliipiscaria TaxID=1230532 RepID=A0ABW5WL99_9FLAO
MKHIVIIILAFFSISSFAQDKEEQELLALKKANDLVYKANELVDNDDYVSAEMEYRKAISEQPNLAVGTYNLGNSYYKKGNFDEALYRHQQTIKNAASKDEKHRAFHNIGNILMQNKKCKEATEAFKNALRNNPTDNETRYNYALAKECAEQQEQQEQDKEDENKDQNEEKNEEEKEKEQDKEQQDENKENKPEDEGEKDEKEGEDKEDENGKPKDEKEDKGKGEEEQKEKPQPQPGQLSPQQIKNLLEAMNDQEQKVQDKVNEQKQKGAKVQTEKDW